MRHYLAVLDRKHLENTLFLTSFAKSIARHGNRRGIIIHGDSEYTERLIQTGMMRADAQQRAVKDLNRRLVGLLADQGVSAIGVNGYQKKLVEKTENQLHLDTQQLKKLPEVPCLLISSLVDEKGSVTYSKLPELARLFIEALENFELVIFSKNEREEILISQNNKELAWKDLKNETFQNPIPQEFREFKQPVILTTATDFSNWPNLKNSTRIT